MKKGAVLFNVPQQFADQRASVFTSANVAHIDFEISHFMCTLNAADVTSDSCVFCESALGINVNISWASVCVCESESLFRCTFLSHWHKDSFLPSRADLHSTHSYRLCLCLSLYLSLTWSLTDGTALILFLLLYRALSKGTCVQSQHKWINYVSVKKTSVNSLYTNLVWKINTCRQTSLATDMCKFTCTQTHACTYMYTQLSTISRADTEVMGGFLQRKATVLPWKGWSHLEVPTKSLSHSKPLTGIKLLASLQISTVTQELLC